MVIAGSTTRAGFVAAPDPDWLDKKVRQWQMPNPDMPTGGRPLDPSKPEELAKLRSMSRVPVFGVIEDDQVRSGAYNPAQLLRTGEIDKVATADLVRYLESPGMHAMLQRAVEGKRPMDIDLVSIMRTLYSRLKPGTNPGEGGEGFGQAVSPGSLSIRYSYPAKVAPQFEADRKPVIKAVPAGGDDALVLATENRPFELTLYPDDTKVKLSVLQGERKSPGTWNKILKQDWTEVPAPAQSRKAA